MYNKKNAINICDLLHVKHFEKYIYMVQDFYFSSENIILKPIVLGCNTVNPIVLKVIN